MAHIFNSDAVVIGSLTISPSNATGNFLTIDGTGVVRFRTPAEVLSDIGVSSPLTTKGDIYTYDTDEARLPVGNDTQVLAADSTEPSGLKWIDPQWIGEAPNDGQEWVRKNEGWVVNSGGASAGESNTASSQGTGQSLYYQKVGSDLQFYSIKSENNILSVGLDAATNDIELTVNQANISITESQISDLQAYVLAGANISIFNNDSGYVTQNTQLTQEQVEDYVGNMVLGNTETLITVTYQDTDGTLDFVVDNDLSNYDNSTSAFLTSVDLSGYVDTTGAPANNQLAIFTDADTIEGDSNITWDGSTFNTVGIGKFNGLSIGETNGAERIVQSHSNAGALVLHGGTTSDPEQSRIRIKSSGFSNGGIEFATKGSIRAAILENGNFGIGATNPQEKLEVALSGSGTNRERVLISSALAGQPGAGYPMLELNQTVSSGNTKLIEAYTGGTLRFSLDNDGDLYASGSVAAGSLIMAYTVTESTITNVANEGIKFKSTHPDPKRANITMGFGGWDTTARVVTIDRDRDDLLIRRNLDGDSSHSSSGSLLRLEKNIINATSDDVNILEWADDTLGELGVITGDGNVGIGTASPGAKLDVDGDVKFSDYGSGTYAGTIAYVLGVDSSGNIIESAVGTGAVDGSGTANYIAKWSDSDTITNSVIYDDGTNVGIGTSSPSQKLEVNGNTVLGGRVDIQQDIRLRGTDSLSNQGVVRFFVDSSNKLFIDAANDGSNRVVIDSSGNVGIGTTSPSKKLHLVSSTTGDGLIIENDTAEAAFYIKGVGDTQNTYSFVKNQGIDGLLLRHNSDTFGFGGNIASFLRNGNVGIGTTSPTQKLQVEGNIYTGGNIRIEDTGNQLEFGNGNVALQRSSNFLELGGYDGIIFKSSNNTLDSQSERMRITSTGNVGIGTTSPSEKLDVAGNVSADAFITTGGTSNDFVKGDGSLDSSTYLTSSDLTNYVTLNTSQTITAAKTFDGAQTFSDEILYTNLPASNGVLIHDNTGLIESVNGTSAQFVKGDGTLDSSTYLTTTGNGSGLTNVDAETLDSLNSTQFLRSDTDDSKTSGNTTYDDGTQLRIGSVGQGTTDFGLKLQGTAATTFFDLSSNNISIRDAEDSFTNKVTINRPTGNITTTGKIQADYAVFPANTTAPSTSAEAIYSTAGSLYVQSGQHVYNRADEDASGSGNVYSYSGGSILGAFYGPSAVNSIGGIGLEVYGYTKTDSIILDNFEEANCTVAGQIVFDTNDESAPASLGGFTTNPIGLYVHDGNDVKRIWTTDNFGSTQVSNWQTAYGWGDHGVEGYLTDAPSDGSEYVRLNGAWAVASGGGTEVDTLQTVTTRGNVTTTSIEVQNDIYAIDNIAIGKNTALARLDIQEKTVATDGIIRLGNDDEGTALTDGLQIRLHGSNAPTYSTATPLTGDVTFEISSAGSNTAFRFVYRNLVTLATIDMQGIESTGFRTFTGTSTEVLIADGSKKSISALVGYFQVLDTGVTADAQTTTGTYAVVKGDLWDTPSINSTGFYTWDAANGQLRVDKDGIVEINANITAFQDTGSNRTQMEIIIVKNGSTTLVGASNYSHRNTTQDKGSVGIFSFIDQATNGDTYEVQVRHVGTAVIVGHANVAKHTYLSVKAWVD